MELCPKDCSNRDRIPYLSTNQHLHVRETVFESRQFLIEDSIQSEVGADELVVVRQVYFNGQQTFVQSEVPLVYRNLKTAKQPITPEMKTQSALMPAKKQREVIFDRNALSIEAYQAMLAALSLTDLSGRKLRVLLCGTGVGTFAMFLMHHFGSHLEKLVTLDTNKEFVDLGTKHFGFTPDAPNCESLIQDAYTYVSEEAKPATFDLVFLNLCSETAESDNIQPPE
jgi:hypothetical protein